MYAQAQPKDLSRIGTDDLGLSPEDVSLLRLISQQKAMPLDQIWRFQGVSLPEAESCVARLRALGCLRAKRLLTDEEPWVWLSRRGARFAETGCSAPRRPPAITRLAHLRAVNEVRLYLRDRFPAAAWRSQRQLRTGEGHLKEAPNGVLEVSGRSTAVHVALSYMQRSRPTAAIADSSCRYDEVLYFCGPKTLGLITSIAEEGDWPNLVVEEMPTLASSKERFPVGGFPRRDPSASELGALRLLAEQGAVPIDQFERFLSYRGHMGQTILCGLVGAGFASCEAPLSGEPEWIWLTERGLRSSGVPLPLLRPRAGGLAKLRALNEARLLIEKSFPGANWTGRRQLLREQGSCARVPSAVVELEGRRHSVDVKLDRHNKEHWRSLIEERSRDFDAVLILCPDPQTRAFMEALQNANRWSKVLVRDLPCTATVT